MSVGFLDRLAGQPLALLSDAFERSPVAKAVLSLAAGSVGDLVEVNAAFCTMVGRSRAELLAGGAPEIAQLDGFLAVLAAGEKTEADGEWRFTHPDGAAVWARLRSVVAHDGAGVAYAVTELVETTDRHALAESEARFRAAFDAGPLGMAILDEDGRFVRINTAFEVMLGRDRVELLGTGFADIIHPDDLVQEHETTEKTEQRYVRRDGSVVWARVSSTGIAGPAGERHRLVQCEDITVRRQADAVVDRENERLRTTIEVQREITEAADDREAVLRLIADRALRVLPTGDAAVVNLIDPTGTWLLPVAGVGSLSERTAPRVPVAGSLAGAAIAVRATLRADDTLADPRASHPVSRSALVRSLVVAPLLAAGQPLGVLAVSSRRPGAFDDADEQQLTLLADALTGALRHAEDVAHHQELLQRATGAVRALEHERTAALAALDRLAQSESRFAEVFDHSPVAKIVVGLRDADRGRILLANPAFGRLLGYPVEQALGLSLAEIATIELDLSRTAGGRLVQTSELRHRDGALIAVDAHISAIADEEGPESAVIQLRDVTADRAAEAALARSEEQFRTAFDGSPIGLLIADETGRFQRVNPAAETLTGRPAADLLGLTHRDITDPADLEASVRARLELLRGAAEVQYDKRLRHADGSLSWTRVTLTMTPGPAGRKWRLVQLQDITAERAAALATEREVQRLRATLAVQRDVTAAAGDRDTALRVVADRAVDLFASADTAAVQLLDGEQLLCVAVANRAGPVAGTELTLAGSLSGLVITTGVPAHCADTSVDNRVNRVACERAGIGSMLVAPLRAEDRVLGCLMIAAARPGAFDDLDEQQLELLAESLSSALRHADDAARNTAALTALATSETRFRLAFENSPLGLTLISVGDDDLGTYLHANPAMTTITGYSTEELCRMTYRELTYPEDMPSREEIRQAFTLDFPPARIDRRYRHKDGHAVNVSLRLAAVRDADGQVLYLVNQVEDVTAQRTAEAQLRWQARLLELIPAAIIVRDLDGTIRWWNAGAERLYGWPLSAAGGRNSHRLLGTVFPGHTTAQDIEDRLVRDGSWDGSLQHLTGDGRALTVLSHQVLHGPAQVLEINTDVTAARAAELALAESEQRFRAQFTHSAAGQLIRTVDGSVVEVNPAYAAMLGHPIERFRTLADLDVLHPDDVAETDRRIAMLFAREADSFTLENRLRHAQGHWVDVASTVSVVRDENGRPKSLICVVTDISARRAAEQARDEAAADLAERNTELEAANHLKLDIIGMLGHEIGNPLSVIRGYTEVLTDDWASLGEARRDRAIHSIARQARRLDDIVREVLGMVTVESGTIVPVRDRLRVREQVQQALTAVDHTDIPVLGDDAGVLVNAGHLQQMLVNLLSNAAKYGGGATEVRILRDGDRVRVQVQDNGPGVPEEFRPRLFERLARAERDAATVRGTGLGLYIVRGLAHANQGDVFHHPNPAGGSVFTLELAT